MTKQPGWEKQIPLTLEQVRGWSYQLGVTDCIAMVCAFIKATTGQDYWPRWSGHYTTLHGAMAHIMRVADHEQPYLTCAVTNVLGLQPQPIEQAQRGDVVEWDEADGPHLGVLLHTEAVGFGPNGVYFVPAADCLHCWKVG